MFWPETSACMEQMRSKQESLLQQLTTEVDWDKGFG
jgi:hypothetical protein